MVKRLSSYLPFATRQGSRAREWLSFLVVAVSDARPPPANADEKREVDSSGGGSRATSKAKVTASPLGALTRAVAAAVEEQASALRNHRNAALYSAIARLVPGAGHYLELEPCLACFEQDKQGGGKGSGAGLSGGSGSTAAAPAGAGVAGPPGSGAAGSASASARGGGGPVFLSYPLDSIKAASKSTENAMLVRCLWQTCDKNVL